MFVVDVVVAAAAVAANGGGGGGCAFHAKGRLLTSSSLSGLKRLAKRVTETGPGTYTTIPAALFAAGLISCFCSQSSVLKLFSYTSSCQLLVS